MSVYVLGSINMDMVFKIDRLPYPGETLKSKNFLMTPGGKGANQAVACSKQGIRTFMLGSVGTDSLSKQSIVNLKNNGVNCDYINVIKDETLGIASILVENGENRIITYSGANNIHDNHKIFKIIKDNLSKTDYLLAQLEIPIETIKESFKIAKKQNATTILNAAPITELSNELLELIDILIVNEIEFAYLIQKDFIDEQNLQLEVKKFFNLGISKIIITLGENGSILVTNEKLIKIDAHKVKAIDTTAAGDTYIGAYLASIINDDSDSLALEYATAAAALTIQTLGAQISIPTREEVKKYIKEMEVKK